MHSLNVKIYTSSALAHGIPLTYNREHNVTLQFTSLVKEDKMPKTSAAWDHFQLSDDKTKAVCQICKAGLPRWHNRHDESPESCKQ